VALAWDAPGPLNAMHGQSGEAEPAATSALGSPHERPVSPREQADPLITVPGQTEDAESAATLSSRTGGADPPAAPAARGGAGTRFPGTGRPIALKLLCANDMAGKPLFIHSFEGSQVTSDWELEHILEVAEAATGTPASLLQLCHAGQDLPLGRSIQAVLGLPESELPTRFAVHVLVKDCCGFPYVLEPLAIMVVDLKAKDFVLPTSTEHGFHWTMKREVIERYGIRTTGDSRVTAHCSPPCPITLSDTERVAACIPEEAVTFFWSYPVSDWEKVERDAHFLEDWAACPPSQRPAFKDFLVVGGFVYLDQKGHVVRITTPCVGTGAEAQGLQFGAARKWDHAWTPCLLEDGRFHRVTIGPLRAAGACFFAWLLPSEAFLDETPKPMEQQPQVPHGGFVYLFHDLASTSPQDLVLDCYFPVIAVSKSMPSLSEPFALVGEECNFHVETHAMA